METFSALTTIADTAYSGATGNPPDLMAGACRDYRHSRQGRANAKSPQTHRQGSRRS